MAWWQWLLVGVTSLTSIVLAIVNWWRGSTVDRLEKALSKALAEVDALKGQMAVFVAQMRQALDDMEEQRQKLLAANNALMEANKHAYETIKSVLTAPGVPPHLAGDWLRAVAESGPSTADSDQAGALPPVTPAPRRPPRDG